MAATITEASLRRLLHLLSRFRAAVQSCCQRGLLIMRGPRNYAGSPELCGVRGKISQGPRRTGKRESVVKSDVCVSDCPRLCNSLKKASKRHAVILSDEPECGEGLLADRGKLDRLPIKKQRVAETVPSR